jgi:hypothetical protein
MVKSTGEAAAKKLLKSRSNCSLIPDSQSFQAGCLRIELPDNGSRQKEEEEAED